MLNYNGLSEWQHFNGTSLNQGCGTVNNQNGGDTSAANTSASTGSGSSSGKTDYYFRDSQIVSHQDCVLDIGMLDLSASLDPIIVTCGRDGLVKLWR